MESAIKSELLGQLALSYSLVVDPAQRVVATRLTALPRNPRQEVDVAALVELINKVWLGADTAVSLRLNNKDMLQQLLALRPPRDVWIELPAAIAGVPGCAQGIQALHDNGNTLLVRHSAPGAVLPQALQPAFRYVICKGDENSGGAVEQAYPRLDRAQSGVYSAADAREAFARGAALIIGWPFPKVSDAEPQNQDVRNNMHVIIALMQGVDSNASIEKLEALLYRDPALAFKLIRYINSAAFGLPAEIDSFSHAIMLLGYKNLKRWLALLLVTADDDAGLRPVSFAAMRRGLMMERMGREGGSDEQTCNELFICGVFSLLDRTFKQPFEELLRTIFVSDPVHQALTEGKGPFFPYLRLVRAVETGSWTSIRRSCDELLLSLTDVNQALLLSLATAHKMG